jgi:hypothetical protein
MPGVVGEERAHEFALADPDVLVEGRRRDTEGVGHVLARALAWPREEAREEGRFEGIREGLRDKVTDR